MEIKNIMLALLILATSNSFISAELNPIYGMVKESSPSALGLNLYYEQPTLGNDWFGSYCHLYASDCLLASATTIRCFYFQNNLIIFLGDANGYIEQIKIFKDFNHFDAMIDTYHKQYLPTTVYDASIYQNLLSDIDMVKLNSNGIPIVRIKIHDGRDIIILHTYSKLMYQN